MNKNVFERQIEVLIRIVIEYLMRSSDELQSKYGISAFCIPSNLIPEAYFDLLISKRHMRLFVRKNDDRLVSIPRAINALIGMEILRPQSEIVSAETLYKVNVDRLKELGRLGLRFVPHQKYRGSVKCQG